MVGEILRHSWRSTLGQVQGTGDKHPPHLANPARDQSRFNEMADANCDVQPFLDKIEVSVGEQHFHLYLRPGH